MARYLAVVGGVLAVLLLIAGWSLPERLDRFSDRRDSTGAVTIRIASARKWPEKVVLDTSQPTFFSPSIDVAPARDLAERLPDDRTDQPVVAAQADAAKPDVRPVVAEHPPVRTRHRRSRAIPSVRVARVHIPMSSRDRPRRAAGSSRWTGGHHRDLPRAIASRVVTHGPDGISRRQIESCGCSASRAACRSADLTSGMRTIVQYGHSWGSYAHGDHGAMLWGHALDAVIRAPRRQSSMEEMGKASVH